MRSKICFCIFLTFFSVSDIDASSPESQCGDWQIYKDEKCIKILDELYNFEDAIKTCAGSENNSQILTIHSKEEQDFISEYLFKTLKLAGYVWIGLRNNSERYEWIDSSKNPYTNWRTGNPSNKIDFNCAQLESDSSQWANELCHERNFVVCQKLPEIPLPELLGKYLQMRDDLNETKERLIRTEERLTKTEERHSQTEERLFNSEVRLSNLEERLQRTEERLRQSEESIQKTEAGITRTGNNEIFNIVFNNKLSYNHLFSDSDGKNKAFIIPLSAMRNRYSFENSVKLCEDFNSTLIEIQSSEKQEILESFLGRLGHEFQQRFPWFWINGERDSSGEWKWLKSNIAFTFLNWVKDFPKTNSDRNNIFVSTNSSAFFGQWANTAKTNLLFVVCEHTFGF